MPAKKKKVKEFKVSVVEADSTKTEEKEISETSETTQLPKDEPEKKPDITEAPAVTTPAQPEPQPEQPPDVPALSKKSGDSTSFMGIFIAFMLSLILGALLIGGIFYFRSSIDSPITTSDTPEATVTPLDTDADATPTPLAEVDLSAYTVQVLNGSGTAGVAGDVSDLLTEAGFEGVDTGNASRYDYTETIVQRKEDVPSRVYTAIEEALTDYSVEEGDTLDEDSEHDVVVTVGSTQ